MAPASPLVAGLWAVPIAAAALGLGYLVADAVVGRRDLDRITRWGLALPGLAAFTVALMLIHIATGGRVLAGPWVARGLPLAVAGVLGIRALRRQRVGSDPGWRYAVGMALLAVLVWGTPVFRLLPLDYVGDTTWHAGWASQLLNGERTPAAVITGEIPNYYPWLFHGLAATVARFTPGGTIFHALAPLQLAFAAGSVLTLFALGRAMTARWQTGAWTALLAGISGGFGFVLLRQGLDVVVEPRADAGRAALRYGGDLLFKRSYNGAFTNLSPPLPRDLAFAMLLGFLLLLVVGLRRRETGILGMAGVVLGLAGLAGGEAFFVGGGVAVLAAVFPLDLSRRRTALALLAPAAAVYAIWLVPLAASYARLGGFQNITDVGPVEMRPLHVLVAWGVTTPLALLGLRAWLRRLRGDVGARVILFVLVVAAGLTFASVGIPGRFGEAFATLGRRHRYWPLIHLGLALLGAVAATELGDRLGRGGRRSVVAVVGALALVSPLVASLALPANLRQPEPLAAALRGDRGSLLSQLLGPEGRRCAIAVPHGQRQALVWSFTGHRLVLANWKLHARDNRARIRWADIYERIPDDRQRRRDNRALTSGEGTPESWRALAGRYGVDGVVVPEVFATRPAFAGLEAIRASDRIGAVRIVWLDASCR